MRILAIRGANLASLAEPFAVDLEAEPIGSSGIFAITGPTGAGKTTLLDAICLALFDRLPRMDTADRGASVGRVDRDISQQAKYDDVRAILRHGAGAAYAEIDFVGQDNRRYRSRWEVNRARGRPDGRLQFQKITLTDLGTRQILGDKKTDTLQEIEKRIGLTFDQFRRSVLLAQGDFDNFIKAAAKDRAELLEQLTGTEIYSLISRAAFERARDERDGVRDLETQLGEHQPLSPEKRDAAEDQAREAQEELHQLETEKASVMRARDWYEMKDRLDARVFAAQAALTVAEGSDQAAEADRTALLKAQKAFSLRAELERAADLGGTLVAAEETLAGAIQADHNATEERDKAGAASAITKTQRDEQRAAYDAIGRELDKAQRLDALIEAASRDLENLKVVLEKSLSDRTAAQAAVTIIQGAITSTRIRRDADISWLTERLGVEALALRIEEVAKDLIERVSLNDDIASSTATIERLEDAARTAAAAREETEGRLNTLQSNENTLSGRIASLRAGAAEFDKRTVQTRLDGITNVHAALDAAVKAADDARRSQAGLLLAEEEKASQDDVIRSARAIVASLEIDLPIDIARLEEAKRSLDLSEAAGGEAAEHLRLKLVDGQPCPVCGAAEHPVTAVDRVLRQRVDDDRQRVKVLEERITASQMSHTRSETQIAGAGQTLHGIEGRKSTHEADLQEARRRWNESIHTVLDASRELEVTPPPFRENTPTIEVVEPNTPFREMLDRALAEARGALKQALDAENEANQLSLELEQARRALTSLSAELVKLRDHEQSNAGEARTLRATVRAKGSTLTGTTSRLDIALSAALPDWKDRVADLGMGFAETCRGLVNEWRRRRQSAETTGSEISRLEASLEGQLATLRAAEVGFTADETRLAEKQKDLDSLVVDRAGVIEGRPVGDVRSEYRERSEAADEEWNNAEVVRSAAERLAATRSSEVVAASKVLEATNRDSATAERLLAEKLSVTQISRADAEAALVRGEAWAAEEQIRLETLRSAVTTAMVTLADRRDAIEQHVVQGQPDLDQHEAETALLDIGARQANAMARYVKISGEVQQDSQARARMAEIKVALGERREKAHVWNRLEELIGSADGARFRRFAQSLTLLHLIQLANRHLADLHPRYELQRAPGSDLVLQVVDRNMADEVRGVHSLSGGERFLVSLSLALGLASMSSGRGIKIESLFIDEGFGALDSNSLAMAVSVLEQLQATGRRVAVISHVDELKERIAVRVEVTPVGSGRSTVQVVTG